MEPAVAPDGGGVRDADGHPAEGGHQRRRMPHHGAGPAGQGGGQLDGLGPRDQATVPGGRRRQKLVETDVMLADGGSLVPDRSGRVGADAHGYSLSTGGPKGLDDGADLLGGCDEGQMAVRNEV